MTAFSDHKPPIPEPDDEPLPEPEPSPDEEPAPHPDPVATIPDSHPNADRSPYQTRRIDAGLLGYGHFNK